MAKRLILLINLLVYCLCPLKGIAGTIVFSDTRILWDGQDVTNLLDYISYSLNMNIHNIIKKIEQKDPEIMKKAQFFYNNQNHPEVINILLIRAINGAIDGDTRYTTEYLQKAKVLINKGASVNNHNLLAVSLCKNNHVTNFLIKHGAKLGNQHNEDLISRCLYKNDIDNLKYIIKHNKFKLTQEDNKDFNTAINQGKTTDEVINLFLDNGAIINDIGFYGLIVYYKDNKSRSSYAQTMTSVQTIEKALTINKALATTPTKIKELNRRVKWEYVPVYPLSVALNITTNWYRGEDYIWNIANKKECKLSSSCFNKVHDYKKLIQLLLDNGANPLNTKEKSIIKKLELR
jgi:hypothetical protein